MSNDQQQQGNGVDYLNPEQKKILQERVSEGVASLVRQESEKEHRSEIAKRLKEELDIPVAKFNKLVKVVHAHSIDNEREELDVLEYLYEVATGEDGEDDDSE